MQNLVLWELAMGIFCYFWHLQDKNNQDMIARLFHKQNNKEITQLELTLRVKSFLKQVVVYDLH